MRTPTHQIWRWGPPTMHHKVCINWCDKYCLADSMAKNFLQKDTIKPCWILKTSFTRFASCLGNYCFVRKFALVFHNAQLSLDTWLLDFCTVPKTLYMCIYHICARDHERIATVCSIVSALPGLHGSLFLCFASYPQIRPSDKPSYCTDIPPLIFCFLATLRCRKLCPAVLRGLRACFS